MSKLNIGWLSKLLNKEVKKTVDPQKDYIVVGTFDARGKTKESRARESENIMKIADLLAGVQASAHPVKSGIVTEPWQADVLSGGIWYAKVIFATPFPDANYSPYVIGADSSSFGWTVVDVVPEGFSIYSNSLAVAPKDVVYWGAIKHGEYQN